MGERGGCVTGINTQRRRRALQARLCPQGTGPAPGLFTPPSQLSYTHPSDAAQSRGPGLRRSPGEGNGNPLQYSFLGNPMDRGAWWGTQSSLTLCNPMDCLPPGSSVHESSSGKNNGVGHFSEPSLQSVCLPCLIHLSTPGSPARLRSSSVVMTIHWKAAFVVFL